MKRRIISYVGENFITSQPSYEFTPLPCTFNPTEIKAGRKHLLALDGL